MSETTRIQLSRARGWRMPSDGVKIDRSTEFGNSFAITGPVKDLRGQTVEWWVGCENYCGQSGDRTVISTSSDAPASGAEIRPTPQDIEEGKTIVRGLLGLLVLAALNAILKRVRRQYQQQYKPHKGN